MRIARHLSLFIIIVLSGLDQAVVQSYAWLSMIYDRSPELGMTEAISDTFSGDHPCDICCALTELTEEENENHPLEKRNDSSPKLFATFSELRLFPPLRGSWPRFAGPRPPSALHLEIPTPPPEFA